MTHQYDHILKIQTLPHTYVLSVILEGNRIFMITYMAHTVTTVDHQDEPEK